MGIDRHSGCLTSGRRNWTGRSEENEKAATVIHASAIEKHEQSDGEDVERRILT
jgi:hypothetical protein